VNEFTIEVLPGNSPEVRLLKLTGPFTLRDVFEFQEIVRDGATPMTIIDLSGVPYMDSASLGSVLGFHVSCEKDGRKYALAGASDRLRSLFRMSGVDSMLHYHTAAAADAAAS
jgi:anti-sigma B factor antagonist